MSVAFGFSLDPVSLLLGCLIFIFLWKISQANGKAAIINKIPGPTPFPFIGNIMELLEPRKKVLSNIIKRHEKFGPFFRIWIGKKPAVVLAKPEYVEVMLKSSKHTEKSFAYKFLHEWLGTGLLTSHGKKWATHRKLITPTFHFKVLQGFVDIFYKNANILVNKLKPKAESQEEFDIYSFVSLCTLDIICETALGTKVNAQLEKQNQYVESVNRLSSLIITRINRVWLHSDFFFKMSSTWLETQKHLDIVQGFAKKVIKNRKEAMRQKKTSEIAGEDEGKTKTAFLDLLLESSTEGGLELLNDVELQEEVETFMFEGYDTTASAISWTLSVIGSNPKIQEDCYQEIKAIFSDDADKVPTLTDLMEMKLLERVIKETLRLYPSVVSIGRIIEEDVRFGEYLVPKGTSAIIGIYAMHRDPKLFPEPLKFDPDRFLPENILKRHPYSYLPFSAGPRNCIGQKFALLEEKVVLSTLIRNFKFESTQPPEETVQIPDLVLRPVCGIKMKIRRRRGDD